MRNNLRWVVPGAVLAFVAVLVTNRVLHTESEDRRDRKLSPASLSERMASYGYKKSAQDSQDYARRILGAEHYIYCPTEQNCNSASGNADHPPVDIFGDAVVQVQVWWPSSPSAQESPLAGKLLTTCTSTPTVVASARVANDEWAKNVALLSQRAWSQILPKLVDSPHRLPVPPGNEQIITVDGWLCSVPTGARPFR